MRSIFTLPRIVLLVSIFLTSEIGFTQSITSSLTACYPLNGNGNEQISSLTATLHGTQPNADHNNVPGAALSFSGSPSSYAELPNSPLLQSNVAVSFSGWVLLRSYKADDHIVFTKNSSSITFGAYSLITYNTGGVYRFRTYKENGSTSLFAQSTTTVALNTWYHVVCTIDNTSLKIYVNGVLENTTASTINFNYAGGKTVILGGTNETNYNTPLDGVIDNFRFYNRVLTAQEVTILYQQDPSCQSSGLPPYAQFSLSSPTVCAGGTVSLTDQSTNGPTGWSWQVSGGATSNSTVSAPVYTFANAGVFTASLVSSNGVGTSTNTATQTIVVSANPTVGIIPERTIVCTGMQTKLAGTGAVTYSWSNGGTTATITVSPNVTTNYTVTGFNANGCKSTATVQLKWVTDCTTSLAEEQLTGVSIFPNPTKDQIMISNCENCSYSVYDVMGTLIVTGNVTNTSRIDIGDSPAGVYLIQIKSTERGRLKKIIKE